MAPLQTRIIEPRAPWNRELFELVTYRRIAYLLAWREVKVRYKQTAIGIAWAVLQPIIGAVVFSAVFGRFLNPTVPYQLFAYVGFIAWVYISSSVSAGGVSIVKNSALVTKVYFPRLLLPISSVLPGLVDLALALALVPMLWVIDARTPSLAVVYLPAAIIMAVVVAATMSIWLSALDVRYRDVRHALPFALQAWLFVSPIVYPRNLLPSRVQALYEINPAVLPIETLRVALGAGGDVEPRMVATWCAVMLALAILGVVFFKHAERTFADTI